MNTQPGRARASCKTTGCKKVVGILGGMNKKRRSPEQKREESEQTAVRFLLLPLGYAQFVVSTPFCDAK